MDKLSKSQKGFTAIEGLLIILILAVIGFGGYYVYHTNHKTKTADTPTLTASSQKTAINLYAGWKSFCSTAGGGLCLKYPSNWTFKQTMSQSAVPESDIFTSPSGNVAVDYLPGGGIGSDATASGVTSLTANNTKTNDLSTYSVIVQGGTDSTFTGYDADLFVGNTSDYNSGSSANIAVPPGFSSKELFNGQEISVLDVVQASTNSSIGDAQANFSSQTEAQAWLSSSEVKTGQLILESASYSD